MTDVRFAPWMCGTCGYLMDAAGGLNSEATITEGDLAICFNCGTAYTLDKGAFRKMTPAELASLSAEERRDLVQHQMAREAARLPDMSRRGGRA